MQNKNTDIFPFREGQKFQEFKLDVSRFIYFLITSCILCFSSTFMASVKGRAIFFTGS